MAAKQVYASLWTLEGEGEEAQGKLRCELPLNETAFDVEGMAFMPGGDTLLAVSRNGRLYALDARGCKLWQTVEVERPLVSVAVDFEGKRVAVGAADGGVGLLSWPLSGEKLSFEALHTDEVRALAFDKAGHLYSGGFDKRIVQWLLREGEEGRLLPEKQKVYAFASYVNDFSLDALGETLGVALSEEKAERTLEVYHREKKGKKEPQRPGDGGALVSVATGEQKAFFAHRGTLTTAGISPDGQMLVTGGFDNRILFHRQGEKPWERKLGWSIRRLRFSHSGRHVWVAAWTPQHAQPGKPSTPSALAYELLYGDDAFLRTPP
jgi:WD40 repeat protein